MAKITFRTASGRVVTFNSKSRRNPSDSPRYRASSRVARAVDRLDAARMEMLRATKKAKRGKPALASKKGKTRLARTPAEGCVTVKFRKGPAVDFCRPAGADKARKRAKGKVLYRQNKLGAYAFVKGPALKGKALAGKRSGQVFTSGGKTYRMISYRSSSGRTVRYALRVKASAK